MASWSSGKVADSESGRPGSSPGGVTILTCCVHGLDTLHLAQVVVSHLARVVVPRRCTIKPSMSL